MLPIIPKVYVDWNDDWSQSGGTEAAGAFTDSNEDMSARVLSVSWQRGRARVNDVFGMGTATIELLNDDGLLNPFDSGSAIYGSMIPGRRVKITATHNSVTYPVFFGRLSGVVQNRTPDGKPSIILNVEDEFGRMSRSRFQSPDTLLTERVVSDAWRVVLQEYDSDYLLFRTTSASTQTIPLYWNPPGGSYLAAAQEVAHQELGGAFFMGRDGKPTFQNRAFRSAQTVHATFTGPQSLGLSLDLSDWWDRVVYKRAGLDTDAEVTQLFQLFPVGRSLADDPTIFGDYIASATDVIEPVPHLDYTVNAIADGSGADITDSVSVDSFTSYGSSFEITFTPATGYLRTLYVRGNAVRQSDEAREITVSDSGAPVTDQTDRADFNFNDDITAIRSAANFRLYAGTTFYPRRLSVLLKPRNDTEAANILGIDLSKRLHITNTTGLYPSEIDEDFFVEAIQGRFITGGTMEMQCQLWHEIAAGGNFFRISGASGGGADYSTIAAAVDTVGDRIAY